MCLIFISIFALGSPIILASFLLPSLNVTVFGRKICGCEMNLKAFLHIFLNHFRLTLFCFLRETHFFFRKRLENHNQSLSLCQSVFVVYNISGNINIQSVHCSSFFCLPHICSPLPGLLELLINVQVIKILLFPLPLECKS